MLTEEEKKLKREADLERYRLEKEGEEERRAELAELASILQQQTILGKRRYEAERKAAQRARTKQREINMGLRDADGRKPKKPRARKVSCACYFIIRAP